MRKSPSPKPRVCQICSTSFMSNSASSKYCETCAAIRTRETKLAYYHRKFPNALPKAKSSEVCCVCGNTLSSHFNGKPYCNKHYLRMKLHGDAELHPRQRTNTCTVIDDIAIIRTSNGVPILIDVDDTKIITAHSWCISKTGYAVANVGGKTVKMHRLLLNAPADMLVDHINGDPLDNRRFNLRLCTQSENAKNAALSKNNTSGHTGISLTPNGRYRARIVVDRNEIHIGTYDTVEEAVAARLDAERKHYKEFAPSISRTVTHKPASDE